MSQTTAAAGTQAAPFVSDWRHATQSGGAAPASSSALHAVDAQTAVHFSQRQALRVS